MQELNWNDLRFVLAVARCETLAGAARRLDVNESTVGRRLAQAEDRLAARLFERTAGRLLPTEVGQTVLASAEQIEQEIQALETKIAGNDHRAAGLVRVTSVPLLVNRALMPALPALLADNPQLRVELIAEPRDLSLSKREADIALRLARPSKESRAIARKVGRLDYAVYGPAGQDPNPLPWITYDDSMADLPQRRWMDAQGDASQAPPPVTVNDAEAIVTGIKAGFGKSLLPVAIADQAPGLARANDDPPPLTRELWLMVHPELRQLTRVRVVMDWIIATLDDLGCGIAI